MRSPEQTTLQAILDKLHEDTRVTLLATIARLNATHVVLFENLDLCSSQLGARQVLCVGPSCTYKHPDEVAGKWLNDLPSQRQYPVLWAPVEEEADV